MVTVYQQMCSEGNMNKAKWMQFMGGMIFFASGAVFLWNLEAILSSSVRLVVLAGIALYVASMVGAAIHKQGEDLEDTDGRSVPAAEDDTLDHGWRKNPFQKGETSDRVIPRDYFLQKRNRWRKVIDAPNKDGY